jgi:hypothetical protein
MYKSVLTKQIANKGAVYVACILLYIIQLEEKMIFVLFLAKFQLREGKILLENS